MLQATLYGKQAKLVIRIEFLVGNENLLDFYKGQRVQPGITRFDGMA